MTGKLQATILVAGQKKRTRTFDNLDADTLTNNQSKSFINKYTALLTPVSTVVSGKITKYTLSEIEF